MSGYVLKRTDQGGGYVARAGHPSSYTHKLENARIFRTREEAEGNRCVENEIIVALDSILRS